MREASAAPRHASTARALLRRAIMHVALTQVCTALDSHPPCRLPTLSSLACDEPLLTADPSASVDPSLGIERTLSDPAAGPGDEWQPRAFLFKRR